MLLEEFYERIGGNYVDVIRRFAQNEGLVIRFLQKFQRDSGFEILCTAIEKSDMQEAFQRAHSFKGVCGNLGLEQLFRSSTVLSDKLRAGNLDESVLALLEQMKTEYKDTCDAISMLRDE